MNGATLQGEHGPNEIGQTKQGGCLKTQRRRAGLAPRAAREVYAENQNLDGHGGDRRRL